MKKNDEIFFMLNGFYKSQATAVKCVFENERSVAFSQGYLGHPITTNQSEYEKYIAFNPFLAGRNLAIRKDRGNNASINIRGN